MIVDTHVHVVAADTHRYPLSPAAGFRSTGLRPWQLETPVTTEELLATTEAAGVNRAIVVQPFSAYGYDNAYHADSAARFPERLAGVCAVDPLAKDAADTLGYWVENRGIAGLRFTTHTAGSRFDDPRANPLWDRVTALGIPVCVLTTPSHFEEVRAMAMRFPAAPIALDHAGGIGAGESEAAVEALANLAELPNLYLKVSTVNFAPLSALGEPGLDGWRRIVARFGPERLMWGSNYPVSQEGSYADMVDLGRQSLPFLSEGDRQWLLAGTAQSLWPQLR
jgi:L-fuconolactonase